MTQEDFEMTHSKLANDPQTAEYVMAAQQGKLTRQSTNVKKVPGLNKELTLKYLKKSQTQAIRQMDEMQGDAIDKTAEPIIVM